MGDFFKKGGLIIVVLLLIAPFVIGSIAAYEPHRVRIDKVECSGELDVVEEGGYFIVRKDLTKNILKIPKQSRWGDMSIGGYELGHTDQIITLSSNNPNVSICRNLCNQSITTDIIASIYIEFNDLYSDLYPKEQGLTDPEKRYLENVNYTELYNFIIEGSIDGNDLKIYGTRYYDHTEESRRKYGERASNYSEVFLTMIPLLLLVCLVAVSVWFIISFIVILREFIKKWKKSEKIPKNPLVISYFASILLTIISIVIINFRVKGLSDFIIMILFFLPFNIIVLAAFILSIIAFARRKKIFKN